LIFSDQHKGGACGVFIDAEASCHTLGETGLASPEFTHQKNYIAGCCQFSQSSAQPSGLRSAVADDL
jgi:hypothetical protein